MRRQIALLFFLLLGLCVIGSGLAAQTLDDEALTQRLERLRSDPILRELLRQRGDSLNPTQKRLLSERIDLLGPAELNAALSELGLSTEGSELSRRTRLKVALAVESAPELPAPAPLARIGIENAAEGEFMQGEDDERGLLRLSGRIRVRLPQGYFLADRVIVDTRREELYADGELVYIDGDSEVRADRIIYNFKQQTGILYNASGFASPVHFVGRNVTQIGSGRFSLSHAYFTTCAEEKPHYNFTARRVWIYDNNKIFAVGALYYVGGVPLLPLPFLFASDWGTGIIAQVGLSQVQGWYLQTTYQFGVPEASLSSWQPMAYRFTLDYYQNTGQAAGVELYRFSPGLSYILQLGAAHYRRYGAAGDYRDQDQVRITNQVQRCYGTPGQLGYYCTRGEDEQQWYKAFALLSYRGGSPADNVTRNLYLRYEDYANQLYEFEFGGRFTPDSTIPALYKDGEAGRGLIRPLTNWSLTYSEQRDDLTIRIAATRNNYWLSTTDATNGQYVPTNDVLPSIDLEKRLRLGLIPVLDIPLYWDHFLHSDLSKQYTAVQQSGGEYKSEEYRALNKNSYRTGFRSYLSFYPWISFEPGIGVGAQKTIASANNASAADDAALQREVRKQSYEYWFSENSLTLGPDLLFLRATHRLKESAHEEQNDVPPVNITDYNGSQKQNETDLSLEFHPLLNLGFAVNSIYDHREFPFEVRSRDRWSYPILRSDIYLDFLNLFGRERENLLSRNRVHFLGLRLIDDYVYNPVLKRDHSNVFGATLEMGGFDLWFLRRLRYLELSYYWYHVYYNPELDHMRFALKLDVQLWSWGYFESELESRAVDAGRYDRDSLDRNGASNYRAFSNDVVDSSGLGGRQAREKAVFNTAYFRSALVLDLHDWEYRFGYELEQRTLFGGVTAVRVVNFYDNRFTFSATLLRFDLGGIAARPSRFLINRARVRQSEIGRATLYQ
ncbi:MAG: hypothetical protein K1X75_07930 [Leptospirales bacterium]|nr:hypothetical protein [Leptospirales bacterium]